MSFPLNRELLRSASKLAIVAAAAGFLTGCGGAGTFSVADSSISSTSSLSGTEPDGQDFVGGAAYWGAKYEANRDNLTAAISFARNLRMMGGARQSVAVLKQVVMKAPDDPHVLSEYAKALTAAGRAKDALPFLARSTQIDDDDWTVFSAYGVALDQTVDHKGARGRYQTALNLSPGNPVIESNLAMSFVLTGELDQAELILRRLVARPDATPQMRQNLSMVTAIKGDVVEAEQLAREDLEPADATNNLALLQQLDARNVEIDIQPLPPLVQPVTPEPAAPSPSGETAIAPAGEKSDIQTPTTDASATALTPAPATLKPSPYTMAPIADPEEAPAMQPKAPAAPKARAPKPAPASAAAMPALTLPVTPAAATAPSGTAKNKPTAILRKSFDVYRGTTPVKVANAAQ